MPNIKSIALTLAAGLCMAGIARADEISLKQLNLDPIQQDWGEPHANKSVSGHALSIGGKTFDNGVGTHADSLWIINLHGTADRFTAKAGVDDEVADRVKAAGPNTHEGSVRFTVLGDGKTLFHSKRVNVGDVPVPIDVDLKGIKLLELKVSTVGSNNTDDHADWVNAAIQYSGQKPQTFSLPPEKEVILTPPARATPRINGAMVVGVRPTHVLLYQIAATGDRPMTFAADGLPSGLQLDSNTGHITGSVATPTTDVIHLTATNAKGAAHRDLKIVVGNTIALTPPMGWNSWNCFARSVSDAKVRSAADAMVSSGLIQHGWTYINIDDCWEVPANKPADQRRDPDGTIKTNAKFPNMQALAAYIHSKGLRAGLYSSPGPSTCGGFTASYKHEQIDAQTYAKWGFDYLKYDWCSYGSVANQIRESPKPPSALQIMQDPYSLMGGILAKQNRDIVFSLCQYGMGDVWNWGGSVGGNCWRTTGDITDTWRSMSTIGFHQTADAPDAKPGNWNDPDMLVVGKVGWGSSLHATRLRPNEQYTHISLWCLLSAPLLIGCDMTQMDNFTKSLLSNDEVLAIDQDPLGKQATPVVQNTNQTQVWSKPLANGGHAVGLFNLGEMPMDVTVKWSDLGISGSHRVRDLWLQKDLGSESSSFHAMVPPHGVVLVKVARASRT